MRRKTISNFILQLQITLFVARPVLQTGMGVDHVDRQALRSNRSLLFIMEKLYSTNKVVNSLDKPKPADFPLAQVIQNEFKQYATINCEQLFVS